MTDKKFCWLPQEVYSSRYYRDGCVWFGYAHKGVDGKWFRCEQFKPRIRFNADGRMTHVSYLITDDPMARQEFENYKIKCNGCPLMRGLGFFDEGD